MLTSPTACVKNKIRAFSRSDLAKCPCSWETWFSKDTNGEEKKSPNELQRKETHATAHLEKIEFGRETKEADGKKKVK